MNDADDELNRTLEAASRGDHRAANDLLPLVYDELRKLAAFKLASEPREHTLQPTALVHEAWLRVAASQRDWQNRQHFFSSAAEAMRRILVDRARRRKSLKRGANPERVPLDEIQLAAPVNDDRLLAIDEALTKFSEVDPRKAKLVKLRYFVGLTFEETAEILGIAVPTAKAWWAYARSWLQVEMAGGGDSQ